MDSLPSTDIDVSSNIEPCCICMEVKDYNNTMLIQCTKCGIRVHVKCYGLSLQDGDASSWLCQSCEYMAQSSPPPPIAPQCAVCPIAGGALRLTDQQDVWCHVLCINWIPELYHSLSGAMDEAVEIALLDRSRSSLKCLVCGLRGGCIQCVSGRCAKAFHVLCAFRSPSSLIFTGYNNDSQQVYHCKGHLSDVSSRRYEMVDNSWRKLPEVEKFVVDHPLTEGKCRFCSNKIAAAGREAHETQCLLGRLSRQDADRRKKELDRLGLKSLQISYARKNTKSPSKKNGKNRGKSRLSNDHVPNGSPSARNGKYKRHPVPMRDCPECGESIRETLMMGHLKNSCPRSRHADGSKLKRNSRMMSPRNFGNGGFQEETEATDLSDVLFASWPDQNSGAPMDSTYFWKVMENHFFSSKILEKKRMEQLSKSLCGVKLEELAKSYSRRTLQSSDIHCRDTLHLERATEDPKQTLTLQKFKHRCDFLMRASHCRCMSDMLAKPMIEISPNSQIAEPVTHPTTDQVYETIPEDAEADIRVLFKNGEGAALDCQYSMRVSQEGSTNRATADDGSFASSFQHDVISTLKGIDMATKKVPLAKDDHLMISLDTCSPVESCKNELQLTDNSSAPTHVELMTDELTPAINLLMEHLKDKMEQNRYRVRSLYKRLQHNEAKEGQFQLSAQTTEMYYREFSSWKQLCASLVIGYKSGDQKEQEKMKTESEEHGAEEDDDSLDDGTCVVCFDGQSPESNPIVFCDRCELAVHQRCYGIAKVPSSEFVCDRCRVTREGLDPASHVFCQLCSLGDGAFKCTIDGKWVHVVCALWCPNVWIGNLFELSDISLVGNINQIRFVDPVNEINSRIAQASSSNQHIALKTSDHSSHPEVPGLELGSLCVHCRVACGRTIQCCHPGCTTSFHPLCGWFDGLPMTISHGNRGYMYAGGGAGLDFQMFCASHLPADYPSDEQSAQKRRRARFRIDSFFVIRNKANVSGGGRKQEDSGLLSGAIVQALISAESKRAAADDPQTTDWTDMTVCSACFEHCAPLVGELKDVNMLHRRQFMIRCQYCNVYIHPECCISDIGSSATIFRSNWICERCTQTGGKEASGCVVCAQSTDYLMPCVDPPIPAIPVMQALSGSKSLSTAIRAAPGGGQQLWLQAHQIMQRQQSAGAHTNHIPKQLGHESNGTASPASNRWIHVYCSKWQKAKTVKRHHVLCAYTPALNSVEVAMRCEICFEKKGVIANCAQCHSRFHPICAAKKKLHCARSNRTDWKFYCEAHPPVDAAFDQNRQTWVTQEIMSQLQDLRRSLERGRMLLEMSRQRDRQQKRLLNLCKLPLMEVSIEVILKRRPTAQMKEVYHELTGEKLTDVPARPKPAPPSPRGSSPKSLLRSSPRVARPTRSAAKRSAMQTTLPERSSKRRRTGSGDSNAATTRNDRRSSRRKSLHYNQEASDEEDMEDTGFMNEEQKLEAQRKFWASLSVPKTPDDFDFVVEKEFPNLLTTIWFKRCLQMSEQAFASGSMSGLSGTEVVTDEGDSTEDMASNDHSRLADAFDIPVPSTAASMTDTIDSTEEVHYCDEWELFSDPGSEHDTSDDGESTDGCDGGVEQPLRGCENITSSEYLLQQTDIDPVESILTPESLLHDDSCPNTVSFQARDTVTTGEDAELSVRSLLPDRMSTGIDGVFVQAAVVQLDDSLCQSNDNAETSVSRRIQVVVRVRPTLDSEGKVVVTAGEKDGISLCVHSTNTQGSITVTECTFDRVFLGPATQEDVFAAVEPSVQACVEGYNATVFAYGQTGTGKTHTLFGGGLNTLNNSEMSMKGGNDFPREVKPSWGIVPRALNYLLDQATVLKEKGTQVDLQLSFLQIYNDRLFDLLTDRMRQKPLLIREHPTLDGTTNVTVQGLSSELITSFSNAMQVIHQGHTNRCVRETEGNLASSRSHAIVQLHVTTRCSTSDGVGQLVRKARLNLVDLAGSEKWNTDVEMEDAHSQELKNINTSLSALGNCVAALTEIGRKHIPYRDSTLTRVLQDSFGGNTQSCLIATVNATQQFTDETIRTLQFADRARSVMQTVRVNEMADGSTELLMAKMQIVKLRERLESEQRRRHETRLKEHQALQRDFQEKLKAKDKEITKLARDNAVFQRWREEDVKKIRALESHIKDLEFQVDSNDGRVSGEQVTKIIINSSTQISKPEKSIPAPVVVTRQATREKVPRQKLTRAGSRSGNAARTYKQVLERYALGTNKEQPKTVLPNKISHDPAVPNDLPIKTTTNQYENPVHHLPTSSSHIQDNQRKLWATASIEDRIAREPENDGTSVKWGAAPSLCVSPVTYPSSSPYKTVSSSTTDSKCSWAYANLAVTKTGYNNDWTSSLLSKSTLTILTQKQNVQESESKYDELWSPNAAKTYSPALKHETSVLKSGGGGAFSYSSLPQTSTTVSSSCNQGSAHTITPCQRHKLAGCMLCAVTESSSRQNQRSPVYQAPKEAVMTSTTSDAARKPQDGPCGRHQLLRCFICMKGSTNSGSASSTSALPVGPAVPASSSSVGLPASYYYSSAATALSVNGHGPQSFQLTADPNSKCAIHALANCILCAGVKAMTRKMAPLPHASPSKTSIAFSASTRSLNISEDHIADRQRRYTLDERILSYP